MKYKNYNFLETMEAYRSLQQELLDSRSSLKTLVFLAFCMSVIVLSVGIIFSNYHWLLLAYPMMGLLIVSYWKHMDKYYLALRKYAIEETDIISIPKEVHFVFTFFGIPIVEMKSRLFTMMSLILGSQLFSVIMYMYLMPMSQMGIIFSMVNSIGIIFSVMVIASGNDLQLVQIPKPLLLEEKNQR